MAKIAIKKASTDVTLYLFIQDSSVTTGAGKTGLAYNTSSLVAYYVRPLGSAAAITLATQTVTGAHSDGGFVEVDATNMPGLYRLDLPDAVCATGVNSAVVMMKGATGMAPVLAEIQLTDFDLNTAFTSALVADAVWDEATADHTTATTFGALDANVDSILADTGTDGVVVASIATDAITAAAIKADAIAEIADGVLDEAMAGHVGAGTLGKAIADTLEDTGTSIPADLVDIENKIDVIATDTTTEIPASITALDGKIDTIDNYIDTEVAAIKAKTDNLPASPAAVGSAMTLTAAYDKAKDDVLTPLATVDGIVDAIKAKTDNLPSDPADQSLLEAAIAAVSGGGTGDTSWTYTLSETDLTPIADATVWVTSDEAGASILAQGTTNASGQVTFMLNAGATVYVWRKKFGWEGTNPDVEVVS